MCSARSRALDTSGNVATRVACAISNTAASRVGMGSTRSVRVFAFSARTVRRRPARSTSRHWSRNSSPTSVRTPAFSPSRCRPTELPVQFVASPRNQHNRPQSCPAAVGHALQLASTPKSRRPVKVRRPVESRSCLGTLGAPSARRPTARRVPSPRRASSPSDGRLRPSVGVAPGVAARPRRSSAQLSARRASQVPPSMPPNGSRRRAPSVGPVAHRIAVFCATTPCP